MKRGNKINKINRPPLTNKAKSAIKLYVELKAEYPTLEWVIDLTLEADRKPREKLYSYLKYRGYIWSSSIRIWRKKQR